MKFIIHKSHEQGELLLNKFNCCSAGNLFVMIFLITLRIPLKVPLTTQAMHSKIAIGLHHTGDSSQLKLVCWEYQQ